jgi:hypothetical protein
MGRRFRSVIDWIRAGYPEEAPTYGYSPLLALMGPISLTRNEIRRVVEELGDGPAHPVDVKVAISRVTGRLPTDGQTRAVVKTLTQPDR